MLYKASKEPRCARVVEKPGHTPCSVDDWWFCGSKKEGKVRRCGGCTVVVIVGFGDFLEVMEEGAGSLVCCYLF